MNRVIVTGASGLIGTHISEFLIQRKDIDEIILLYFKNYPKVKASENVKCIKCDLRSEEDVSSLIETIGNVENALGIHCAADVSWHKNLEEVADINIGGSLNFSRILSKTSIHVSFLYLSTAYTSSSNWEYKNSYEESKALAEIEIRKKYPKFNFCVFSFSLVIGSTTDGFINHFSEGLYPLIKCMFIYDVPFLVGRKECKLDVVPLDWAIGELKLAVDKLLINGYVEDIIATAGDNRISIENLVKIIFNNINNYRRSFGLAEKPVPLIISYRRWLFLKRSKETWNLEKKLPKEIKFLERLLESYCFYIENDKVSKPQNISCIAPNPNNYFSKVIAYWFENNKDLVCKKWDIGIEKAVSY